jgi:hypothetical protein
MSNEEIKEMRKALPCKMLVWDDDETTSRDRIVTEIFNNGSCRSVDGDSESEYFKGEPYAVWTYRRCKPIPKKTTRPMNPAEINRWWWDNVRAGRNPAWHQSGATFFTPPFSGSINDGVVFCADYTGTESDVFLPLTTEVNE